MEILYISIGAILGAIIGFVIGYFIIKKTQKNKEKEILRKAELDAENIKKDKIIQAKEKFLELKENHEKTIINRERKVQEKEINFKQKETNLNKRFEEVKNKGVQSNQSKR